MAFASRSAPELSRVIETSGFGLSWIGAKSLPDTPAPAPPLPKGDIISPLGSIGGSDGAGNRFCQGS
jgi:hypothetical protein